MTTTTLRRPAGVWLAILALFAGLVTLAPADVALAADHDADLVPQVARTDTPNVVDGSVRSIVQVGNRIVMAGDFTQVQQNGTTYDQPYLAAYFLDSGLFDAGFDPVIDRDINVVRADADGDALFIGGRFNTIDGTTRRKVAKLSSSGQLITAFTANATAQVQSLAVGDGELYVGGTFKKIKGQNRLHVAAVDADTGRVDAGFDLPLSGAIGRGGTLNVFSLDLTADDETLLVVHSALQVAGQNRVGAALVDVSGATATLLPWRTRLYEDNLPDTGGQVQIQAGAIAPDGSYFVTVATGGDNPPTNDTALKWSVGGGDNQQPQWISRHFDSVYAVDIAPTAIYVGGHFQYEEAPGSTNPFPGDPDINYGFGAGLGPAVLGDEVVAREQLGALDPATGKSLNWDPGASGFHGVEAVTVIDRGLLVGHDGNRIGGNDVGRGGFLDFEFTGGVGGQIDTSIDDPRAGRVYLDDAALSFTGTAEAPAGVDRVQIEVQNTVTKQWLRRDGTMGSYQNIVVATSDTGPTTVDWSYSADLTAGDYRVFARVFDDAGGKDPVKASVRFDVEAAGIIIRPETQITEPAFGTVLTDNTVTFRGRATDDTGVGAVRMAFYETNAQGYLRPDGSIGAFAGYAANLSQPASTVTDWDLTKTLPNGTWRVTAAATDVDGNQDTSDARQTYVLQPGNNPPQPVLDSPTDGQTFTTSNFTVSGSATDDAGVRKMRLFIRNETTFEGPQPNGFVGPARWIDVPVTPTDGTNVTWTYSTPDLAPGRYRVQVRAVDTAGAETPSIQQELIYVDLVVPGDDPPQTVMTSLGTYEQSFATNTIDLSGTATDDVGVTDVLVSIFDTVNRVYVQSDGTPGTTRELLPASVANPGATSTGWSLVRTLPDGNYRIGVFARDTVGQFDPSDKDSKCTCLIFPGDDDPTTQVNTPVDDAVLAAGPIAFGGRVRDTESVVKVEIWIRNNATREGPRRDGSLGNPQWISGFLTNPGGTGSDFQYTSIALPPGDYLAYVRSVDANGKVDLIRVRLDLTLE